MADLEGFERRTQQEHEELEEEHYSLGWGSMIVVAITDGC